MALSRYIADGKVPTPQVITLGRSKVHVWTPEEVEHVRQLLPRIANGRKTRYKKKQSAKTRTPPRAAVPHKSRSKKK